MNIVIAGAEDIDGWVRLRVMLWPDETIDEHRRAAVEWLGHDRRIAFVALDDDLIVGFVEASVRYDHVNGCDTSPVVFLEGTAVAPDRRRRGIGGRLIGEVERWGQALGCTELGSDADEENHEGHALHRALGFEERERVVFYRKLIGENGSTLS